MKKTLPTLPATTFVVGLGHKARQGKNIVADMLQSILTPRYTVRQYSFSRALYDHCRTQYGMGEKDAPLLQRVGLEMREKDEDAWVRAVAWQIVTDKPDVAVITDVRFKNEMRFVKQHGGATVRVMRFLPNGSPYIAGDRPADHPSEIDLDDEEFGCTLYNDGTLEDLYWDVMRLTPHMVGRLLSVRRE